jgi:hypothetical protein
MEEWGVVLEALAGVAEEALEVAGVVGAVSAAEVLAVSVGGCLEEAVLPISVLRVQDGLVLLGKLRATVVFQ